MPLALAAVLSSGRGIRRCRPVCLHVANVHGPSRATSCARTTPETLRIRSGDRAHSVGKSHNRGTSVFAPPAPTFGRFQLRDLNVEFKRRFRAMTPSRTSCTSSWVAGSASRSQTIGRNVMRRLSGRQRSTPEANCGHDSSRGAHGAACHPGGILATGRRLADSGL